MKRRKFFKVALILVSITCVISGCSKQRSTVTTPKGTVISNESSDETATDDIISNEDLDKDPKDTVTTEDDIATDAIPDESPKETSDETETDAQSAIVIDTHEAEIEDNSYNFGFYYDQLTREQKVIYLSVFSYYEKIKKEYIEFKGVSTKDVRRAIQAINYDQVFLGVEKCTYYQESNSVNIKLESFKELSERKAKKVEKKAEEILESVIETKETEESIIRKIYNWCCANIKYDETPKHIRDVYGALIDKACVCEGYAEAFKYLTTKVGIKCIKVTNLGHSWNYVQCNGRWYSVDVTWGQANTKQYLLEGKESLQEEDHIPEPECGFKLPKLAQKAYYPTDDEIQERVKNLQENIKIATDWLEQLEDSNYDEELYQLLNITVEKAKEILGKIEQSAFGCYINTSEFSTEYKELINFIKALNEKNC